MKRCPQCGREYDNTMMFCLDDGAELLYGPATASGGDEPATAILHSTAAPGEAPTRAQIHTTEQTAVLPKLTESPITISFSSKKSLIVAALGITMVAALGIGSYLYFGRRSATQIESIAVMPFVNASGNADIEYLSDGVTESLINNLSQLSNLSVKGRSSVFRYKGKDVEPQQVASELKVQAILNGRVTQRGGSVTISLDLVDGGTGDQIWGDQYTRKTDDLAALQSEIARDVSHKLRIRLTGAEQTKVVKNQSKDSEAYQLYLQGRYNWNKRTPTGSSKAIAFFKQAVEKDPTYAMAYVGLAEAYSISEDISDGDLLGRAAALKALEIDPTLGEPHATLGIYLKSSHDYSGAEDEYRKAILLSPNYPTGYHWLAEMLVQEGRFDEGFDLYKKALEIDPLSMAINSDYGIALGYARQFDRSIEYLKGLVQKDPDFFRSYSYLAWVYRAKGMYEEAINADEKAALLLGEDPDETAARKRRLIESYRSSGPKGYLAAALAFTKKDITNGKQLRVHLAAIYSELGQRDEAFEYLEQAYKAPDAEKLIDLATLKVAPVWDNLRGDPRLDDLMRREGLPRN